MIPAIAHGGTLDSQAPLWLCEPGGDRPLSPRLFKDTADGLGGPTRRTQ